MSSVAFNNLAKGSKILVAMSGGVDSSVAAYRLVQGGFDVVGVTMHLVAVEDKPTSGAQASGERACCSIAAAEDARRVAVKIGIPHYMLNLADMFYEKVMKPTRMEYEKGRTPNPCVQCNRYMKFNVLFDRAKQLGCTHVATGHYARIIEDDSGLHLLRGVDPGKDQTYFLAFLTESELERIVFPLGWDTKESIRAEAKEIGLNVADRPESQDLCFFTSGGQPDGIDKIGMGRSGEIVSTDGEVIGTHDGIGTFTIGQRKGVPGGMSERMYVIDIDAETGKVVIGNDEELFASDFAIDDISLVSESNRGSGRLKSVAIQVRYRSKPVAGIVEIGKNGIGHVHLDSPVRAITPGQVAVWYSGNEVIGAGTILTVTR